METINKLYRSSSYFRPDFPLMIKRFSHTNIDVKKSIVCRREFWKIFYVICGTGSQWINDEEFPLQRGSLCIIHPDDRTAFNITSEKLEIYNILFLPELIEHGAKELSEDYIFFSIFRDSFDTNMKRGLREQLYILDSNREIESLIKRMAKEYQGKAPKYRMILKLQLLELLALICRLSNHRFKHDKQGVVDYIQHIIENKYTEDINFGELARHAGITQSHMSRLFREKTGTTISDQLLRKRIACAQTLLASGEGNISEICYSCGFNDLSHFYKAFKGISGYSPGQYRSRHLQSGE